MRKKILSLLLCSALSVTMLAGCGSSSDDSSSGTASDSTTSEDASSSSEVENTVSGDADAEDAFVIWGWNTDIQTILDGPFAEDYPDLYSRIVFVNTGGSDYYQTKIDEILDDESNSLYPDMMGLEVDYVLKYVESNYLLSVSDLGISESDYANQYGYNLDLGTDSSGNVKALFWQATPGSWQLRADLCETYFGTTDPDELQTYFETWDKVIETAEMVNEASGGTVKLLSGYSDVFRVFSNARTTGWYDSNDVITIDDQMTQYMEIAKTMYEEELTYNTSQWSEDWYANMAGDGEETNAAIAYTGCPWFTYWSLDADVWGGNTILVEGPQQFYWGGTGLAATVGCSDTEMAGTIIKYFTCETESMVKINALNGDFVNNTEAIEQIIADGGSTCDMLYADANQEIMSFYLPLAENIDASTVTAEDQDINSLWNTAVDTYADGTKDADTMLSDFKAAVHDTFSYLTVE